MTSAIFKTSDSLDSVTFTTNLGTTFKIGGDGGIATKTADKAYTENIPDGASIVGLYGTQEGSEILSLGLVIA